MCNCNEEINKKCPNRVCAYCDWHLELQAKEQECEKLKQWKKDAENLFKTQTDNADKIISRYKQVLDEIKNVIKSLENENILTFPDLSLQDNVKAIMGQCNSGYKDILDIINKAKGNIND